MWTVVGGEGRRKIARSCRDRSEAEQWARELIKADITPVRINGEPFEPEMSRENQDTPRVA